MFAQRSPAPRYQAFHESGDAFFTDLPVQGEIYAHFLPPEMYAKRPEEIETLIKVNSLRRKIQRFIPKQIRRKLNRWNTSTSFATS